MIDNGSAQCCAALSHVMVGHKLDTIVNVRATSTSFLNPHFYSNEYIKFSKVDTGLALPRYSLAANNRKSRCFIGARHGLMPSGDN
jgi:hypothetical protein